MWRDQGSSDLVLCPFGSLNNALGPRDGRGGPFQRGITVEVSRWTRVVPQPDSKYRQNPHSGQIVGDIDAVFLAEPKQPAQVVCERKLDTLGCKHSLHSLLNSLLSVKSQAGIGDSFNRQQ